MATFEDGKNKIEKGQYAYQYYINKGLTPVMAAGIVGNLAKESNFNTSIKGTADNKGSVGIAQWHSNRLDNLKKFAGSDWQNLDRQLDFVLHELNTTEKKALNSLRNARTVEEATTSFMNDYERPSSNPKINRINDRITEALNISGQTVGSYSSTLPRYNIDGTINIDSTPINLETSSTEYEELEVQEAKQDIEKKSFQEDLSKIINLQQQEQQPIQQQEQVQQDFIPSDLPDPYNYIQQDPGYNFEEFQKGGSIPISENGMYEYPNQKVLVPTSGSITMKKIEHPILGISQETGEQILMRPEQEYFFKDTKNVLEIPIKNNKNRFR